MKKLSILLALIIALTVRIPAQQRPAPEQGTPPATLGERDGHWTANNAPEDTDSFEVYVVEAGDSLWSIAGRLLNNSFLWPQLWEANEHIINPHWIYPEDRIRIRPVTQITEAEPEPAPAVEAEPEPETEPAPPPAPVQQVRLPASPRLTVEMAPAPAPLELNLPPSRRIPEVKVSDLYCSGFVTTTEISKDLNVLAKFPGTVSMMVAETEYLYLSQGASDGVVPGEIFTVVRPTRSVRSTREGIGDLGQHYLEVGQLQAVLVQPDFALARVIQSCDAIEVGDPLVGFEEIDLPEPAQNRRIGAMMPSTGKITGAVALGRDVLANSGSPMFGGVTEVAGIPSSHLGNLSLGFVGEGQIVYIDLGDRDGVRPGDTFLIYRPLNFDSRLYEVAGEAARLLASEREVVGELVVIKVRERAATALVTFTSDGVSPGDLVELR